jgi:DNA replication licensing factor MCM2
MSRRGPRRLRDEEEKDEEAEEDNQIIPEDDRDVPSDEESGEDLINDDMMRDY